MKKHTYWKCRTGEKKVYVLSSFGAIVPQGLQQSCFRKLLFEKNRQRIIVLVCSCSRLKSTEWVHMVRLVLSWFRILWISSHHDVLQLKAQPEAILLICEETAKTEQSLWSMQLTSYQIAPNISRFQNLAMPAKIRRSNCKLYT